MPRTGTTGLSLRLILISLTLATGALEAGPPRFVEGGYRIDSLVFDRASRIAEGDFDADGKAELALTAWSSWTNASVERRAVLVLLDHEDEAYRISPLLALPTGAEPASVLAWSEAGVDRIILVGRDGVAHVFGGEPLAELTRFPVVNDTHAASIGDVDADGRRELLLLDRNGFYTYVLPTGQLSKTHLAPGYTDVAIAQLDADPALEIVLTGAPFGGKVVDGATLGTEWTYPPGFGALLTVGDFSGNGTQQWAGAKYWHDYAVFGSSPWAAVWNVVSNGEIKAIGTARPSASPPP